VEGFAPVAITFIEPMLLKPAATLPLGEQWRYELKFDGFRGLAVKDGKDVRLFSRNGRDLSTRFPTIVEAVGKLKMKSAVIDGEIVCLDEKGRPCFEDLQNFGSALENNLFFYAFDLLAANGANLITRPLEERKECLRRLLPKDGPLRLSDFVECDPEILVKFATENRLEGVVAKRIGSVYEPGKRSGAWAKFKTYQTAEFLIGGYLPCRGGVESLAVGFWREKVFKYAARVEVYLKGKRLQDLCGRIAKLKAGACAFERVPIKKSGDTWSVGLTKEDAEKFVWIAPRLKVHVRFTEWTSIGALRHAGLVELVRSN
jgi:DNA ligase D-like protein (predicted ligase)